MSSQNPGKGTFPPLSPIASRESRSLLNSARLGVGGRWAVVGSLLGLLATVAGVSNQGAEQGNLTFKASPSARFHFEGIVGDRLKASIDNWLLPAPGANPGMLEMFRLRDRQPPPNLVPWAGEFVGKYLISAIQTLRMAERPDLRATVVQTVGDLIKTQAADGYLGPFPKPVRLRSNWDLWGHYHCLLALLMWSETSGDAQALNACRRAADLACETFLNSKLRVFDAGSQEMNMAFIHGLGRLYRAAPDPRYLTLMREIEKDWERAGDYLNTGLAGLEFFETPRPRWESLHDLQGLVELYRITGEEKYRTAFQHHWRSIVRWDRRNTGGFSSGEQATGNPYAPTPIETCCTVAWMALTTDWLQLAGDPQAADELELSLFNGALGAQHPSGRWCTYNTPMDGTREASAHTIVFQARAGTPELNCCSVNGPRGLGILSEWAVLSGDDALVVNYYGPGMFQGKLADNTPVALNWETDYPMSGKIVLRVEPLAARRFRLLLRIPAWSRTSTVNVNGSAVPVVTPGRYLEVNRRWLPGDRVSLDFDLRLRAVPGARETEGRASVYRGPILLAYDQGLNEFDDQAIPPLDLGRLNDAKEVTVGRTADRSNLAPWLVLDLPAAQGQVVRACDFTSAGGRGTRYRSWLPVANSLPPSVVTRSPADGAVLGVLDAVFRWSGARVDGKMVTQHELLLAPTADFAKPLLHLTGITNNRVVVRKAQLEALPKGQVLYWEVISAGSNGRTESAGPPAQFRIETSRSPGERSLPLPAEPRDLLIAAKLRGVPYPETGDLKLASNFVAAAGPEDVAGTALRSADERAMLVYGLEEFPDEDYSVGLRMKVQTMPNDHLGQVCSAWAAPMDDPLRLCLEKGRIFARLEAGQGYSTAGFPVQAGRWYHVAAVKAGTDLFLYVDGERRGQTTVPLFIHSRAREIALGGNPHYGGNEFLDASFADFICRGRALTQEEVVQAAAKPGHRPRP